MLSGVFEGRFWSNLNAFQGQTATISVLCSLVFSLFGLYIIWRIWSFTILPWLYPNRPQVLPYWIPFLGHAVSFFNDADGTFAYGRNYFRNTREPFTITAAGETLYIITSIFAVNEVYRNTEQLTFDDYITDMMVSFGATPYAIGKMWEPSSQKLNRVGGNWPPNKPLAHIAETIIRQQLQPGQRLDKLQHVFLSSVHSSMTWDKMTSKVILPTPWTNSRTVSLLEWTREALLEGATTSFFGPKLREIEPDLFDSFFSFDDCSWKLTYNIPAPWSNDMKAAKAIGQNALTRYFEMSTSQRPGACWLVEALEIEMKAVGIQAPDIAAYLTMIYWVINANAWKVSFWMLAYVLHNPSLLAKIRLELKLIMTTPASQDPNSLANSFVPTATPHFLALYHEVLRLITSSVSVRNVASPTYVSGKELQPGGRVIIPYRQLLLNDEVFGADAGEFHPERFMTNDKLNVNPSYRPYGGGSTYCPGQFLAKAEVLTCVALALWRFDMQLIDKEDIGLDIHEKSFESRAKTQFPRLEIKKPCLGIMGPVDGDDVFVNISCRA